MDLKNRALTVGRSKIFDEAHWKRSYFSLYSVLNMERPQMKIAPFYAFLVLAAISLLLCAPAAYAQSGFRIGVDIARYRGDSTKEYVEVYYSFDVSKLKFVKLDTALRAEALMEIYFKRSANDSIVAHQMWRIPFTTNDSSLLGSSRTYADVLGFFLAPDVYRLYVVGGGSNNWAKRDSFSVPLDLQPLENKHVSLSDVELCTSIVSVGKDFDQPIY